MEDWRRSKDGDSIRLMIIKMRMEIPFLFNLFLLLERFDFIYSPPNLKFVSVSNWKMMQINYLSERRNMHVF